MGDITIEFLMALMQKYCNNNPTCDGCRYGKEHQGCYFRGKTPREWEINYDNNGTTGVDEG
jgi:hypothetical protein